jgi:hypothetical protein
MIGMAALSAFSMVNLRFLPPPVRILWPAAFFAPLLSLWVAAYRRRLRQGRSMAEFAEVRIVVEADSDRTSAERRATQVAPTPSRRGPERPEAIHASERTSQ